MWYAVVFPSVLEPHAFTELQRLALRAQHFTSFVSIDRPNALLLEIKGSIKLFGSLSTLHAQIDAAWNALRMQARSAIAPSALAALWFARAGKSLCIEDAALLPGRLAEVPIECTCWHPEWLHTLRAMGVTRLGELLRLPRSGLSRRLSPAAVVDLDIAFARQAAPRGAVILRKRFYERCDFEAEIDTVIYLQRALEPLVERCARFLRERQAGLQMMELRLFHRSIPATRVRVKWASITSEQRRLKEVLNEKLTRLPLAAPVRSMEMRSGVLQSLSADSLDAFKGLSGGVRDTVPQLVERLRARLGEDAVYGVCPVPEHRPEAAWQRVHELALNSATFSRNSSLNPVGRSEMPRPVWLLSEPVFLAADRRLLYQKGLIVEQGPERIESGWWDGKGVARDYYIVRQLQGAKCWIFQQRRTQEWYLHGLFA
ncbi:MAG: DNA polymerase Y family protein [Steroidobacteraceae bacterium]